ncbi:MAG: single-stranded-DNA-specific exonuclease RecJ [Clostridia bacterium]
MLKKWEYYEENKEKQEDIVRKFNISPLLANILINRGIIEEEDIEVFLNPTRHSFHDPYLMPDMKKAVERILQAIKDKQKIMIYGDYDVDGITSITVLKKFLEERGLEVGAYIPNRLDEGYGLNKEAIKQIYDKQYRLMITVDCGISGIEEIEYANELGIQTIITDHHEPAETLPNALAVVDQKIKTSIYPFRGLAGCGVVFKLIQAIGIALKLDEKEYLKYLDIVCVGTISDIVPLVDENRVIAKLGLKLVNVTKNIGLKTLLDSTGYSVIDSGSISFGVAPRINACGRMGFEQEALKLFLTEDKKEAMAITEKLNQYNKERQETEKKIFEEAVQMIEESEKNKNCIILGSQDWHHGVIGIVSSKVTDMYYKPSILVCFEEEEAKGSGRSISGFDLHEALGKCSSHLERFGGHEMAVGLSLKTDEFKQFKEEFEQYAENSNIKELVPVIKADGQITLKDFRVDFVSELKLLEPFGEANKVPLFIYRNLKIDSIRALSEGKHLKLTLKDGNTVIQAIGFNMGALSTEYLIGDKIDMIGTLEINRFNGFESVQMNLKDIRKSY